MNIYKIGPDVPRDLPKDDDQFEWLVYHYKIDGYDGYGQAVALCKEDGLLYFKDLYHCSCFDGFDGGMKSGDKYTVASFLKDKDDALSFDALKVVKEKVAELTGW